MTTFNDKYVTMLFENVNIVERSFLGNAYDVYLVIDHYVYLSNLVFIAESFYGLDHDHAIQRAKVWAAAWALPPANIDVSGTLVERWNVQTASIAKVWELVTNTTLDFCMPFGNLVNFINAGVVVPDPC